MKFKRKKTIYECVFKRFFDFIISFVAILLLLPLFLVLIIASKISIGGKVFFCQYRPGKNGKVFKLIKFRSMTNEVDENGVLLPDSQRITKFGKFLRKTSLDEIPQLFNILAGQMAIVGPRPRLVKDMVFYNSDVLVAYSVRPGLTGKSQVSGGRSESSWEQIFEDDLSYCKKITFFGDIKILFQTVKAIFSHDSSSEGASSSKREYYYADYLLKTNKISQNQYNEGLKLSEEIIKNKGAVKFNANLQPNT